MTPIPWALIISLGIVCFALLIKFLATDVIEDENQFLWIVFFFLICYAGAAFAVGSLNPIHFITDGFGGTSDDIAADNL